MEQTTGTGVRVGQRHVAALLLLAGTLFLERFAYFGARSHLTMQLVQVLGFTHLEASSTSRLFTAAVSLGPILGALLAIVVPRRVLAAVGLAPCAVGVALAGGSSVPVVYAGLALLAVGLSLYKGALFAAVVELLPGAQDALRGAVLAVFYAVVNVASLAAAPATFAVLERAGHERTALLLACVGGLALLLATTAAVVAPRRDGPAPRYDGLPVLGGLALIALAAPAMLAQSLANERMLEVVRAGASEKVVTWLFSVNPLVVVGTSVFLAGGLFGAHALRARVLSAHLIAVGSVLAGLAALPVLGGGEAGGPPSVEASAASAALGAVAELVLFVPLMARTASAGQPYFGALVLSVESAASFGWGSLARAEWFAPARPGALVACVVLCVAAGVALFLLARPLQRALFRDDADAAPAPASPTA